MQILQTKQVIHPKALAPKINLWNEWSLLVNKDTKYFPLTEKIDYSNPKYKSIDCCKGNATQIPAEGPSWLEATSTSKFIHAQTFQFIILKPLNTTSTAVYKEHNCSEIQEYNNFSMQPQIVGVQNKRNHIQNKGTTILTSEEKGMVLLYVQWKDQRCGISP